MLTRPLLAALLLLATPAGAEPARVIDGDSIGCYRLWGIDAPELAQTCDRDGKVWACGREAADALRRLVGGHEPACEFKALDRYRRTVALCRVEGVDLSAAMVESGMALAFRRYSLDYVPHEDRARAERRGMWAGEHQAPWDWRAAKRGGR